MCRKYISSLESLNEKNDKNPMSESELDSTGLGSTSHSNLKESASSQDTKNTTVSSVTTSHNNFPSQKLSKLNNFNSSNARKRIGGKAQKKDPLV